MNGETLVTNNDTLPHALVTDFGWALRSVSIAFQDGANAAVASLPSGSRGYLVLLSASEDNGRSQLAIARQLGVDKTVMTYLVDALVEADLISREPDPADRRIRRLILTPTGRAALDKAQKQIAAVENRLLASVPETDAARFRALLAAVAANAGSAMSACDPA